MTTIAQLIEKLQEFDADAPVWVANDGDPEDRYEPDPEYCDWGHPGSARAGIYL